MKQTIALILAVTLLVSACGCDPNVYYDPDDTKETWLNVALALGVLADYHAEHVHGSRFGQKVQANMLWALRFFLEEVIKDSPASTSNAAVEHTQPLLPTVQQVPTAKELFYDHAIDGVFVGNMIFNVKPAPFEFYRVDMPFILAINVNSNNKAYASITFLDAARTLATEKFAWETAYTDDILIKPNGTKIWDVSISFDPKVVDKLIPLSNAGKKIKLTLKGRYTDTTASHGGFSFGNLVKSQGYDPEFSVLPYLYRVTETKGLQGIWTSSYHDSFFVRDTNGDAHDVGEFWTPITLTIWQTGAEPTPGNQNWSTQLFSGHFFGHQKVKGDSIYLSTSEKLADGYAIDLKKSKKEKMTGTFTYYDFFGVEHGTGSKYTFERAGFGGKKVKVKSVKPAAVSFTKANKQVSLTINGKGFAPGSLPHFSHPDLELTSVVYANSKTLKVKVAPRKPIKKGTKIGVKVFNPDNINGSKSGALTAK